MAEEAKKPEAAGASAGAFPFYSKGPHFSQSHENMPRYSHLRGTYHVKGSLNWAEHVEKEHRHSERFAANQQDYSEDSDRASRASQRRESRQAMRRAAALVEEERTRNRQLEAEIAELRELVEQQMAARQLGSPTPSQPFSPQGSPTSPARLEALDARTVRKAARYRADSQEDAFQIAHAASVAGDHLAKHTRVKATISAPDIRATWDRSQKGTATWHQQGEPTDRTVVRAKAAEAKAAKAVRANEAFLRVKTVDSDGDIGPSDGFDRGFWRRKPDAVQEQRVAVAKAKEEEARRHAEQWSAKKIKKWVREKARKRREGDAQERLGALAGGVSPPVMGGMTKDKKRDSNLMSQRAITNI